MLRQWLPFELIFVHQPFLQVREVLRGVWGCSLTKVFDYFRSSKLWSRFRDMERPCEVGKNILNPCWLFQKRWELLRRIFHKWLLTRLLRLHLRRVIYDKSLNWFKRGSQTYLWLRTRRWNISFLRILILLPWVDCLWLLNALHNISKKLLLLVRFDWGQFRSLLMLFLYIRLCFRSWLNDI